MIDIDLTKLSAAQKQELLSQLAYDQMRGGVSELSDEASELWEAIHDARGQPPSRRPPASKFMESYGKTKFNEAAEYFRFYVESGCPSPPARMQRLSMLQVCVECLMAHLLARGIPPSPAILCNSIASLDFAVEQRYPGYRAAKLLGRVAPVHTER